MRNLIDHFSIKITTILKQGTKFFSDSYWFKLTSAIIIEQTFSLELDWSKRITWPETGEYPSFIIHQIFSLARDWSKRVTWTNIPQLKLGNIREYSPIFKTARVAEKIWRIINTIASIWSENMLGYLSLDIICSSKLTGFLELRSRKTVRFLEQIMSADKYPSICIFAPNGGYCLYIPQFSKLLASRKTFER